MNGAANVALQGALRLAEGGFYVFPCRRDSKAPCTPRGFHDAEQDPAAVERLFRRFRGELVGIPTGAINGFDALDIDPRHGGHLWAEARLGDIPLTRVHGTRSGGRHYLFQADARVRNADAGR
jgi:hypothetical protein